MPNHFRIEAERYALDQILKIEKFKKFSKQYPKITFKHTSINLWKTLLKKSGDNQTFNKKGQPNLLSERLVKTTKHVIFGSQLAGTVISRSTVIVIGIEVVKADNPGKAFATLRSKL